MLSEAQKRNAENNKLKSDYTHKAVGRLIVALVLTVFTAVPYLLKRVGEMPPEVPVRLVALVPVEESKVTENQPGEDGGAPLEPTKNEQTPAAPPKRPPEPPVDYTSETPPQKVE